MKQQQTTKNRKHQNQIPTNMGNTPETLTSFNNLMVLGRYWENRSLRSTLSVPATENRYFANTEKMP